MRLSFYSSMAEVTLNAVSAYPEVPIIPGGKIKAQHRAGPGAAHTSHPCCLETEAPHSGSPPLLQIRQMAVCLTRGRASLV